jgi:recombination protein RecA
MPAKPKKAYTPPASLTAFRASQEKKYPTQLVRQKEERSLDFISTGVAGLDAALGGGWARGRYHQVLGQPGSCKTAMVIIAMINALEQYPDKGVSYIDVENTVTDERFLDHGLDPDDPRFFWRKPNSAEEVVDMLREDMRTGLFSFVALDSVGAMEREDTLYEKTASEVTMGRAAQLLTRMSKQVASISRQTNTAVMQVNQYRKDFESGYDKASGPIIMGYMTTDSVVMRKMSGAENILTVKDDQGTDIEVAHKVAARVERSKLVAQGKKTEFWYHKVDSEHGTVGIDAVMETMDRAMKIGALYKEKETSSWWFFPDGSKENGEKAVMRRLREDEKALEAVRAAILEKSEQPAVEAEVKFEIRRG